MMGFGNDKVKIKTRLYHNYSRNDYTFLNRATGYIDPISGTLLIRWIPMRMQFFPGTAYCRRSITDHIPTISFLSFTGVSMPTGPSQDSTSYEGPDNSNLNNQQDTDHRVVAEWKYYLDRGKLSVRSGYSGKQLDYSLKNQVPGLGIIPAIYSESRQQSLINKISYIYEIDPDLSLEGSLDMNMHNVVSEDSVSKAGMIGTRSDLSLFMSVRKNFLDLLNLNLMVGRSGLMENGYP